MKPISFLKSVFEEVKKVEWLPKDLLVKYSFMVITFAILSTIAIACIDIVFIKTRTIATLCFDESVEFSKCANEVIFPKSKVSETVPEDTTQTSTGEVINNETTSTGEVINEATPTPNTQN